MYFYVAATHDRAILGMRACRDMDLLFVNESNICSVQNNQATAPDVDVVAKDDNKSTATERKQNSERRDRGSPAPSLKSSLPTSSTETLTSAKASLNRHSSVSSRSTAAADAVGQPLTKDVIVERYADLFTGVGRLEGEVHLDIDPTAKPVQMSPRRLPIPIKDDVKRELGDMCKNGIIEPVTQTVAMGVGATGRSQA